MMTDSNASRNPADSTKGLLIIPMLLVAWMTAMAALFRRHKPVLRHPEVQ